MIFFWQLLQCGISLFILTAASLENHPVLNARCNCRPFVLVVVWCIARQADRNGETVKHFHNCSVFFCIVFSQFCTPYCTNLRQYSKRPKRGGTHDNAAICCSGHVQENMLSSIRFTSIQGKTISRLSEFRVSLQNFRVSFWHPKTA